MENSKKEEVIKFFENLYEAYPDEDAYIEVVINYKKSKYFKLDRKSDAATYCIEMSKKDNEVHFGPSLRLIDLGQKRSKGDNVHSSSSLFIDIDPPDKSAPAEDQKAETEKLKDTFLSELKEYSLEPTFIVESGHGFHVYFVFNTAIEQPSENWVKMQGAMINFANSDKQVKNSVHLLRVRYHQL